MSKVKGAIDFTPRLTNNNPTDNRQDSNKTATPQQQQSQQLTKQQLHQQPQQQQTSSIVPAKSTLINKTTTSPLPRTSTPTYNPFLYTYSRDQRGNNNDQQQHAISNVQLGDILNSPQLQQQSQYQPQYQQYPMQAQQGQALQQQSNSMQQQDQSYGQVQQQQIGKDIQDQQGQQKQGVITQSVENGNIEEGKSEVFTSNYRVSNSYRPLTSASGQAYVFQTSNNTNLDRAQMQQQQQQQQGYVQDGLGKKSLGVGKAKLNKSSKSETPLKPILKDFSMTVKQHQQQSSSQPQQSTVITKQQQQQPQSMPSKQQTPQTQQQQQQQSLGGYAVAGGGTSSTKSNSSSTHVTLQPPETQKNSIDQYGGNVSQVSKQQGQVQWKQDVLSSNTQGIGTGIGTTQQQSVNSMNTHLVGGSRYSTGNYQISTQQRMLSPKTEPNEYAATLSSQNFYSNKQRRSPIKNTTSKDQANITKSSPANNYIQAFTTSDQDTCLTNNPNITQPPAASMAIKQNPPNSNNLTNLGLARKSQTPKRNATLSVGGNIPIINLGDTSNQQQFNGIAVSTGLDKINNSSNSSINTNNGISAGTNSMTVSWNQYNQPMNASTQNSIQMSQTQNKIFSSTSGRQQGDISPIRKNIPFDTNQNSIQLLPLSKTQSIPMQSIQFSSQQPLFEKAQEPDPVSPGRHKKSTSDIDIKEKDPSEMFLIRDQDTGQVYDIRQIDKIDTFSKTNNQEYFDKLKRRHKNAWQGWWNSKKENNQKMIESVRSNNFQIVEQLLQHERADLRADTDFKDSNQWASIHYAAYNGNSGILNLLISHEADMSLTNNLEQTALMIAAEKGYAELVEICIKAGANVNKQDLNKNTALHFASRNGCLECVKILLKARDIDTSLRNVESKIAAECSKTNEISIVFKEYEMKRGQVTGKIDGQLDSLREEEEEDDRQEGGVEVQVNQQQKRTVPTRSTNYEQILNQSVLQGFYGQKLTLSQNNGQGFKGYQQNQQQQQQQKQQQSSQQPISLINPSPSQPISSYTNQQQLQRNTGAATTVPLVLTQTGINQQQQEQQQQQQFNGVYSSPVQLPTFTNTSQINQKAPIYPPITGERASFEQQLQMQSSTGAQGLFQSSQLSSSSQSVISNNRSSTYKSGVEQQSPPGGQGMRQSISSQGSSVNSSNQLTDSQIAGFTNSGLYISQGNQSSQQGSQQQPWRVIIHDFPNESIMRMFDNTESAIIQQPINVNNNILSQTSDNNNNNTQQQSLFYNYSSNHQENTQNNNNNSNLPLPSSQGITNGSNGGFGRSSATPQNANTLVSTNETIVNSGSPSHKHHKVHSQDVLPSSAAANVLRKQPSHSTQASTTPQGQWVQNQSQPTQVAVSLQSQSQPEDQQVKPSEYVGPEQFRIITQIGRGSFGEVYLVEKKNTENYFAMKMLHKSKVLGQNLTKYAMTERNVLSIMCHPFIVKLMFAFQTSKDLFLIMEYMPGGDLSHALQRDKRFSESRARIYLVEIMLAIRHLHKHDIIYRDLKPENIVIDAEGHAMLTDFGLSKDGIYDHYSTHSFCGSLAYLAPEMLKRTGHGKAVDYYHLGVLLYEMLTGTPPFFSDTKEEICHNIEYSDIRFPSHVSDNARNLISKLLVKNPAKRLGNGKNDFEEMKKHPFFSGINWSQAMQRKLKPPAPFIKPIVDSKNNSTPNFMMTMTPQGMMTDNHINGWSFINNVDQIQARNNNNNNFSKF